jgi:hypothetical protein
MDYRNCGIVSSFWDFTVGEFEAEKLYRRAERSEHPLVPVATKAASMHH